MDNKTTQVNINRPKRDGVPPWAWGAIAAAALALILGTIFFLNQPKPQSAVAPTPTVTSTPLVTVVEVTPTTDVNAPTATVVTVQITATQGASATPQPTATARIVQITATAAPTKAAPPTVTTSTGGASPTAASTVAATTGTQATASPQATLTADEQRVLDSLKLAQGGDKVTTVHLDGGNLAVTFQAPDASAPGASATARQLVRNLLSAMSQNTVTYSKLMLKGMSTAAPGSQGTAVIDLTYDQNTVATTDWASVQDADVYNKAEAKTLQPPFDSAP